MHASHLTVAHSPTYLTAAHSPSPSDARGAGTSLFLLLLSGVWKSKRPWWLLEAGRWKSKEEHCWLAGLLLLLLLLSGTG